MGHGTSASAKLKCDAGLVYDVLTDYDSYFEWLPFIGYSKLLAKEGDLAIAEFEVISPRHAKIAFEWIHTRNKSVLGRRISGEVQLHQILWELKRAGEGETEVTVRIDRAREFKELFAGSKKYPDADKYLSALQSRVAAFTSDFALEDESGRKLIEIFETDDGLDLWIFGKKYLLKPVPDENV